MASLLIHLGYLSGCLGHGRQVVSLVADYLLACVLVNVATIGLQSFVDQRLDHGVAYHRLILLWRLLGFSLQGLKRRLRGRALHQVAL